VEVRGGEAVTPEALLEHLHESGLSVYDMPEYFLELDALPLTASGKILKRALVDEIAAGALTPRSVRWQKREKA
jgi:acyl-CoA synthetase